MDKKRHDTTEHDKTRRDKTRHDETRHDRTRQDTTRQDKTTVLTKGPLKAMQLRDNVRLDRQQAEGN